MAVLSTKASPFHVHLPAFDGPLDLLLTVLQSRRLDVSLVSLAAITREFVDRVRSMEDADTEDIADFLVMAARLVELKARLLLPNTSAQYAEDEQESAVELVDRLRAYEKVKAVATFMAECLKHELTEYPRIRQSEHGMAQTLPPALPRPISLREIAKHVLAVRRVQEAPEGAITRARVSLEQCMQSLVAKLIAHATITFREAIGDEDSSDQVVGTFLALLHLWKRGEIDVRQSQSYGEMFLTFIVTLPGDGALAAES